MLPPAPARFSTTTGRPSVSPTMRPMTRASVSVVPPDGLPTTMVMGLPLSCAHESVGARAAGRAQSAASAQRRRRAVFIVSPGVFLSIGRS